MTSKQQPALTLFAVGMIGLGILALIFGDFALVWQPVSQGIPGRTLLAYLSGVLMLLAGAGLLFQATAAWSVRILFPYLIVWLLLKLPPVLVAPQTEGSWLGFGELAMLLAGGWILFVKLSGHGGESSVQLAVMLFAASLIPVGLSHLVYAKGTADLVPAWLPFRTGWAYLTGVGQMACGLGMLFSIFPRAAAVFEASMLTLFTLLIWLPGLFAAPTKRLPWTAFFISWAITSAAWVVASNITRRKGFSFSRTAS